MLNNFGKEENRIISALREYECLTKTQLIELLYDIPEKQAESTLSGLTKRQVVFYEGDTKIKLDPRCPSDYKVSVAFWILLKYIPYIRPMEHYRATYPSQIYFLQNRFQNEILVLEKDDEYLLNILLKTERNSDEIPEEDMVHYIIAVPKISMIPVCRKKLQPILKYVTFVVYDPTIPVDKNPIQNFYKGDPNASES